MRSLGTIAVLLVLFGVRPAYADYEATEARLKNAGVDDELRERVHGAIRRGVRWLLSEQREDGGFAPRPPGAAGAGAASHPSDPGYSCLCALALRHAGTKPARLGLRRARRFLFEDSGVRRRIVGQTYHAGLAAMLVAADDGPQEVAADIADALRRTLDRGSWGYGPLAPGGGPPWNLSTAQFGALGLWACERAGAEVPTKAWAEVAARQVRAQQRGRWGYDPKGGGASPRYPQGTFMGLANLLLAEAGVKRGDKPNPAFLKRVAGARRKALDALAVDAPAFLERFAASEDVRPVAGGAFGLNWPYYVLYALEKVCIFADVEEIGGVRWYETGARALLARQADSGCWGPVAIGSRSGDRRLLVPLESRHVCTAFALLFLLRGSETYHPVTPRPVDGPQRPRAEVTPSR